MNDSGSENQFGILHDRLMSHEVNTYLAIIENYLSQPKKTTFLQSCTDRIYYFVNVRNLVAEAVQKKRRVKRIEMDGY